MVFWFMVAFILILTIYRRVIEPFLEGYRNKHKSYNEPLRAKRKRKSLIDRSAVEDADFEDLK